MDRVQIGWLGELAVDEALVVGSGGRLHPWIPFVDAHGVDRAYSWNGVGPPTFAQLKLSRYVASHGRHEWDFRASSFPTHDRFSVVLCLFDPVTSEVGEPCWCMDGKTVLRIAERHHDSSRRTIYRLEGSPTGADRLAPYRYPRAELWKLFAPGRDLKAPSPQALPTLRIDQGGLYEFAWITELLKANHKDLLVFRPAFDTAGRDLLLQLVGTPLALSLQVKGTALLRENGSVHFSVHRSTFVASEDFWLVLLFWERRADRFFPECWLVPSLELERRMARTTRAPYWTIDAHLKRTDDRWSEFRHPVDEAAGVLRDALTALRLAADPRAA
ncbi:MAG TPA: hypothetical protein VFR68_03255 [Candidatus Dormibacteraeota bacterium]|nr:hypothetical protein [Candidatus Dormibacteraeota bacterium]